MPVTRTLRCPDCSATFPWLFLERDESDFPNCCPRCGNVMTDEPQSLPGGFSIGTAKGKAVDLTYRQIEDASNVRAEAAGDPSLKITNMKDNLREGDVAAMAPQPSREYQNQVAAASEAAGGFNHWQHSGMGGVSTEQTLALARAGAREGTGAGVDRRQTALHRGAGRPVLLVGGAGKDALPWVSAAVAGVTCPVNIPRV